jgi:hypothetical protein
MSMKTSPFKVIAGGVEKPQEKPKSSTAVGEAIADFITPDSIGEALMNFIPFGGVAGKSKAVQNIVKKVPGLSKLFKSGTTITKNQKINFQKGLDDGLKAKGGVSGNTKNLINGKEYYKDALHYGKATDIKKYDSIMSDATKGVAEAGKVTDAALAKMNYNVATDLKPQHVKKIGRQSGRNIYEVSYPDGATQKFWRSSGGGGKTVMYKGKEVSSKGFFGTIAGHVDNKVPIAQAQARADKMYKRGTKEHAGIIDHLTSSDGYFIKTDGWQGYGSKTYEQTGAALKEMFDKGLIK